MNDYILQVYSLIEETWFPTQNNPTLVLIIITTISNENDNDNRSTPPRFILTGKKNSRNHVTRFFFFL